MFKFVKKWFLQKLEVENFILKITINKRRITWIKEGLLYAESHEWIKVEGNVGIIGISDHAQHELGSVVFIDLPKVGKTIKKGDVFGAVESVKAASDLIFTRFR
jgi:hypothetical protein